MDPRFPEPRIRPPDGHLFGLSPQCLKEAVLATWQTREKIPAPAPKSGGLYLLLEGHVHHMYILENGFRKVLYVSDPGHFLYEGQYFSPGPLHSFAEAQQPTRTAFFSRALANRLVRHEPDFAQLLLTSMADKLVQAGRNQVDVTHRNLPQQLLRVIRRLAAEEGRACSEGVELRITQTYLAELMGIHRVSLNRLLQRLVDQGSILTRRGSIVLLA